MNIESVIKPSFAVLGREGSTNDGDGFVQRLWAEANARFGEIAHLAKRDSSGALCGIWGAMTDFSRSFQPWTNGFRRGLYLAGAECVDDAKPPVGWTKWIVPGFESLRVECDGADVFSRMLEHLKAQHLPLAGAVQDFTDPQTGRQYMLFPIRRL